MNLTRLAAAVFCAAFALATPAVTAQETSKGSEANAGFAVSLQFQGGTLADYLKLVEKRSGRVNIVVPPAASEIEFPPVTLASAPVHSAIELVNSLVNQNEWKVHVSPVGGPLLPETNQVYTVRVEGRRGGTARSEPRKNAIFSLRFLTEPHPYENRDLCMKAETVLTAIETALAASGFDGRPSMKFHADSGILVIRGDTADLQVANEVIDRLERDLRERKSTLMQTAQRNEKRATKVEESIAKLEAEVEKLKAEVAELKKAAGK